MRFSPLSPALSAERTALQQAARRYGLRPSKERSQHFLLDRNVATKAVSAAALGPGDRVLEVGAGFGILTEALLASKAQVVAFEIDDRLVAALTDRFRSATLLEIVAGDFFSWFRGHNDVLASSPYRIIANLPYHASSYFFQTVLSAPIPPSEIVVLLQAEVAERIAAAPGGLSLLSLAVQVYGTPKIILRVPRTSFWPQPDVDSALLHVRDIHCPADSTDWLFRLARMAFAGRRKQLRNSLQAGLRCSNEALAQLFSAAAIAPTRRPQELSVAEWWALARAVAPLLDTGDYVKKTKHVR